MDVVKLLLCRRRPYEYVVEVVEVGTHVDVARKVADVEAESLQVDAVLVVSEVVSALAVLVNVDVVMPENV